MSLQALDREGFLDLLRGPDVVWPDTAVAEPQALLRVFSATEWRAMTDAERHAAFGLQHVLVAGPHREGGADWMDWDTLRKRIAPGLLFPAHGTHACSGPAPSALRLLMSALVADMTRTAGSSDALCHATATIADFERIRLQDENRRRTLLRLWPVGALSGPAPWELT